MFSVALNATTFSTTVVPTNDFVNNGSKFWLALFDARGQLYFHSGPQGGWIPYQGGGAPEYGLITAASMSIGFTKWDVSGQVGSKIYIGYGHSFEDMLANGRFMLIHTIQAPAADPMAAYSGAYTCYNQYYLTGSVILNLTSSRAIVDTTSLYSVPVNTIDVSFSEIGTDGKTRVYNNFSYPLKMVTFDPALGEPYPLGIAYRTSSYSSNVIWVCKRT